MCGIAGIWSKRYEPVKEDELYHMLSFLKYRGPDAEGTWSIPKLALGHKRLKIRDLSDAANQPFTDGRDVLVFNGEIFNYILLRSELSHIFRFKTNSDTEVLFRALQLWDERALEKIDGQFAFAFYRASSDTLLLTRDHVGICPLYIHETEDNLYFSSEIKPILSLKKFHLYAQGVIDYFMYRYNIQNGRTLFEGIKRFPPAHFLKINFNTGQKYVSRYWSLKFDECDCSRKEIQKKFNSLFDDEIRKQSIADVPVGIYLSGGIDSGALLCGFAKKETEIKSFTLSFSKDDSDSMRVAELARRSKFKKNLIEFSPYDFDSIEDVVFSLEEPFGDLIICANYLLAKNASKSVKVVLSGEGGDESFCGYDHQRTFFKMIELYKHNSLRLLTEMLLKICPPQLMGLLKSYPGGFGFEERTRIGKVFNNMYEPSEAYIELISLFNRNDLKELFSRKFQDENLLQPDTDSIKEIFASEKEIWHAVMRSEIEQLTMVVNLLKQDRFSMRFSIEGRVPLVSRRVLEFAASLPYREIYSSINKRLLLKYSGSRNIKKRPFSLFSSKSYINSLIELMNKYVTQESVVECGILSWPAIQSLYLRLTKGNIIAVKQAMAVLIFQIWFRVFRERGFIK